MHTVSSLDSAYSVNTAYRFKLFDGTALPINTLMTQFSWNCMLCCYCLLNTDYISSEFQNIYLRNCLTLMTLFVSYKQIIWSWYSGCWWVGCYLTLDHKINVTNASNLWETVENIQCGLADRQLKNVVGHDVQNHLWWRHRTFSHVSLIPVQHVWLMHL